MINHTTIAWVRCLFIDLPDANSVTTLVLVKAWSLYEWTTHHGISHFLEHMFFKWGKKWITPKAVAQAIEDFGWETNAFTNNEYAGYYIKAAPSYLRQSMEILADMLLESTFMQEEMEREKGVVLQEIAMYNDEPQEVLADARQARYLGNNLFGRNIIGTNETVMAITRDNLVAHRHALYTKDNSLLVIAGRLPSQAACETMVSDFFWPMKENCSLSTPSYIHERPLVASMHIDHPTQQNHMIMSFDGMDYHHPMRMVANTVMTAFWWCMSSRLFQNIREQRGLCYYVWWGHSTYRDYGYFRIRAGLDKTRFAEGSQAIYDEIDRLFAWGLTDDELTRAKRYASGQLQMGLEGSDSFANYYGKRVLLYDDYRTLDDVIAQYEAVSMHDVQSFLATWKPQTVYQAVIG